MCRIKYEEEEKAYLVRKSDKGEKTIGLANFSSDNLTIYIGTGDIKITGYLKFENKKD